MVFCVYLHTEAIRKREQMQHRRRFITTQEISSISSSIALLNIINYASLLHSRVLLGFSSHEQNNLIHLLLQFVFDLLLFLFVSFCLFILLRLLNEEFTKARGSFTRDKILIK